MEINNLTIRKIQVMENKRKRYSADFKFKVVLEALKERQTMSELTAKLGVHST